MRRITTRFLAPLACALALASPAASAPGLRLSWDHCSADGQVVSNMFACDTNAGSEVLDFSFESPVAASDRTGVEITIHLASSDGTLPVWWQALGAGACRPSALAFSISVPGSAGWLQPMPGLGGSGGLAALAPLASNPSVWRLPAAVAVPPPATFSVGPGTETFAMQLVVKNLRTVGTGACGGCS